MKEEEEEKESDDDNKEGKQRAKRKETLKMKKVDTLSLSCNYFAMLKLDTFLHTRFLCHVNRFPCLVVAANTNAPVPSFLRRRISEGQPLPSVVLAPVPVTDGEGARKFRDLSTMMKLLLNVECVSMPPVTDGEEARKLRAFSTTMKLLLNMERASMPPELLIWLIRPGTLSPEQSNVAGTEPPV